ncbi:ubiquinone biosynthesis mono0xygenase COQ6 [Apiospora rasikravindrae]|uniref:Ubiquinone biosynthesis mono0xygenase COQ6 n=1 Tax=Apiospora rasikravindrae TaxID=990691 RepID=A0ABR1UDC1_9PEZI
MEALLSRSRQLRRPASWLCRSCTRQLGAQARRTYANAASQPDIYDVVCVGGGPAGLSLLTALRSNPATAGLRVALVEAQDLAKTRDWKLPPDRFSNRCSSLTPSSANFLDRIGAWEHLARERVQPYHEMQVWDGVTDARIEFDWEAPSSGRTIAYMTENLNLTSGLLRRMDGIGGTDVFDKVKVENITLGEDKDDLDLTQWPIVHLSGGKQLAARLLVGADGANSPVRAFAEIESRGWDYERHGVVATLEMEDEGWGGHNMKIAYQRFLPTGPVAMLPMPGRYATMVWSTTPRNAALQEPAREGLLGHGGGATLEVAAHTCEPPVGAADGGGRAGRVGRLVPAQAAARRHVHWRARGAGGRRRTHDAPSRGTGAERGAGGRRKPRARHRVLGAARAGPRHAHVARVLQLGRYAANHVMLGVVDKLHKLYSVESGPLVPLRSFGLNAVNAMRPLKNFFMEQAAGKGAKIF